MGLSIMSLVFLQLSSIIIMDVTINQSMKSISQIIMRVQGDQLSSRTSSRGSHEGTGEPGKGVQSAVSFITYIRYMASIVY